MREYKATLLFDGGATLTCAATAAAVAGLSAVVKRLVGSAHPMFPWLTCQAVNFRAVSQKPPEPEADTPFVVG